MFLLDNTSTHGTFLNKRRLKPKVYAPLRVGDVVKFGQSTRLYTVQGPAELMPEEGPSRQERQQMAALAAQAERREKEAQVAKAQMARALAKSGVGSASAGASWGLLGEDAEQEAEGQPVDWREYAETKGLTEKQRKIADRIRKYEWKLKNLQAEADRIRAKENGAEGLTVGQATQLARNEQAIERLQEELEDAEEMIQDSVQASLRDKARAADGASADRGRKRAHPGGSGGEEESGPSTDEDDDFYDRTRRAGRRRRRRGAAGSGGGAQAKAVSVQDLFGRKQALQAELRRLEEAIVLEEAAADGGGGGAPAEADPLDAFMSGVRSEMEEDKLKRLRSELEECRAEIARAERLIKLADPDGWFNPASKQAASAAAEAARQLTVDKEKRAAQEAARVAAARRAADAAPFVPEVEEPEEEDGSGGREEALSPGASAPAEGAGGGSGADAHRRQTGDGAAGPADPRSGEHSAEPPRTGEGAPGLEIRRPPAGAAERSSRPSCSGGGGGGLLSREQLTSAAGSKGGQAPSQIQAKAAASVAETMAMLSRHRRQAPAAMEELEPDPGSDYLAANWKPPEGQTGDGRTALNDKLGY